LYGDGYSKLQIRMQRTESSFDKRKTHQHQETKFALSQGGGGEGGEEEEEEEEDGGGGGVVKFFSSKLCWGEEKLGNVRHGHMTQPAAYHAYLTADSWLAYRTILG
jgi:hypothetical protein